METQETLLDIVSRWLGYIALAWVSYLMYHASGISVRQQLRKLAEGRKKHTPQIRVIPATPNAPDKRLGDDVGGLDNKNDLFTKSSAAESAAAAAAAASPSPPSPSSSSVSQASPVVVRKPAPVDTSFTLQSPKRVKREASSTASTVSTASRTTATAAMADVKEVDDNRHHHSTMNPSGNGNDLSGRAEGTREQDQGLRTAEDEPDEDTVDNGAVPVQAMQTSNTCANQHCDPASNRFHVTRCSFSVEKAHTCEVPVKILTPEDVCPPGTLITTHLASLGNDHDATSLPPEGSVQAVIASALVEENSKTIPHTSRSSSSSNSSRSGNNSSSQSSRNHNNNNNNNTDNDNNCGSDKNNDDDTNNNSTITSDSKNKHGGHSSSNNNNHKNNSSHKNEHNTGKENRPTELQRLQLSSTGQSHSPLDARKEPTFDVVSNDGVREKHDARPFCQPTVEQENPIAAVHASRLNATSSYSSQSHRSSNSINSNTNNNNNANDDNNNINDNSNNNNNNNNNISETSGDCGGGVKDVRSNTYNGSSDQHESKRAPVSSHKPQRAGGDPLLVRLLCDINNVDEQHQLTKRESVDEPWLLEPHTIAALTSLSLAKDPHQQPQEQQAIVQQAMSDPRILPFDENTHSSKLASVVKGQTRVESPASGPADLREESVDHPTKYAKSQSTPSFTFSAHEAPPADHTQGRNLTAAIKRVRKNRPAKDAVEDRKEEHDYLSGSSEGRETSESDDEAVKVPGQRRTQRVVDTVSHEVDGVSLADLRTPPLRPARALQQRVVGTKRFHSDGSTRLSEAEPTMPFDVMNVLDSILFGNGERERRSLPTFESGGDYEMVYRDKLERLTVRDPGSAEQSVRSGSSTPDSSTQKKLAIREEDFTDLLPPLSPDPGYDSFSERLLSSPEECFERAGFSGPLLRPVSPSLLEVIAEEDEDRGMRGPIPPTDISAPASQRRHSPQPPSAVARSSSPPSQSPPHGHYNNIDRLAEDHGHSQTEPDRSHSVQQHTAQSAPPSCLRVELHQSHSSILRLPRHGKQQQQQQQQKGYDGAMSQAITTEAPSVPGGRPAADDQVQMDNSASFLRAARAGNLEKVLEYLKGSIDINTSNANGLNALHLASKEGHVPVVKELLHRGAKVNAATKKGNTALHIASLAGQTDVVRLLVEKGANVNAQSQNGFTPLYMAAQENHDAVVRLLLANNASQSLATEDGFTPLAVALQQGHDKVVAVLLENDAKGKVRLPALHIAAKKDDTKAAALLLQTHEHNPDVTSKSGFTPLHIAAHYGNANIAALLLEKKADVNFPAKHQITPLHVAAKWGKANMVKLLLEKGAKIDASTRDGLTPLHCAARSGHDQVVDQLIDKGAPITAKTKNGLAPLHMASQGDHVESAKILLNHKAPVDEITVDYLTALHVAAHCGHVGVAKLLLEKRADANSRALNGFTPLHIACKKNRIKVVELLLRHGASIEATTESGLTPLHVASFMGCMNIVIYLIQHGANADVPTVRGETPLHLAARANQTDIVRILLRNGAQVDTKAREQQTPLHIAARLGNTDIVGLLLQHGAHVDSATKDQYTALHIAAKEDQEDVVNMLLDHGASVTAATKKGFTPLHLAAKYGNLRVAKLLLQKEAPVDAQGKNGVTPLHVAAHYDHNDVALLLLEQGASPHAAAKNGYTPLHIAAKKNQMDIGSTLLEYGAKTNAESKAGFSPLHLAAQEGHAEMASLLIEHGANVDAAAKNGLTPLHLCAQEDKVNAAAVLAKHNARIDPATAAGYTPLHVACHFGQTNMIRFLLQHCANVNATTSHGYTPLHQAAQQGHTMIINLLLENRAQPNATTNHGQTALSIAQKLGYISVIETLKVVTETTVTTTTTVVTEEKYKVVAPETMHETFMSDSEDEAEQDNMMGDHSFKYLTADEMKSLGDDSLPIDVTRDERLHEAHVAHIAASQQAANRPPGAHVAPSAQEEDRLSPSHLDQSFAKAAPDNVEVKRTPVHAGFLVSFMVDARGGAMRGCRHSGVRVIIPPRRASMPMRVTCRFIRKEKLIHPPPLMEGEACAARVIEMGPAGAKFLGPVVIEVPHFASLRGKEREIIILRSDNGESWKEHTMEATEDAVSEVLNGSFDAQELSAMQDFNTNRVTRILTTDFPQYFAVVCRNRQEVHSIGPEGGMVSSTVVPQVQAIFPDGALTKKIKVGLQAQPIHTDVVTRLLGNRVAVSPIVTVEPRRRKFHKPITLTIPLPRAAHKGMTNQYSGDAPTLRLLCSITGGQTKAQWEDVTGSTPLTFVNDCVSFTTTVSARFWLIDCRQVSDVTKFACELYQEAVLVPFMAKFVVFAKRHDPLEAQLRVFCMTDDREDKTLESQEHFAEVAKSRDVEVLEGTQQYLEFAGNLVPITKSGEQLALTFEAFKENRVAFNARVKDMHQEPMGRVAFMKEPRGKHQDSPQTPVCNLNIKLPERIECESVPLEKKYGFVQETGLGPHEMIHRGDLRLSDIAKELGGDWPALARQLNIPTQEIQQIRDEVPNDRNQQALTMLRIWIQRMGPAATGNGLEKALQNIGREDIVRKCMSNIAVVTNDVERAVAKVQLSKGPPGSISTVTRTTVMTTSSADERDIMKDAESAEETSSGSAKIKKPTAAPAPVGLIGELGEALKDFDVEQPDVASVTHTVTTHVRTSHAPADDQAASAGQRSGPIITEIGDDEAERMSALQAHPVTTDSVNVQLTSHGQTFDGAFETTEADADHPTTVVRESHQVLPDGTVQRTISKVTTTFVQEEGQPPVEVSSKQHESEAAASDADTSQVSVSSLPEDEGTASSGLQHMQGGQLLDEMMAAVGSLSATHTSVTTRTVTETEYDSEGNPHEKTVTITTTRKVTTDKDGKQTVEEIETRS